MLDQNRYEVRQRGGAAVPALWRSSEKASTSIAARDRLIQRTHGTRPRALLELLRVLLPATPVHDDRAAVGLANDSTFSTDYASGDRK